MPTEKEKSLLERVNKALDEGIKMNIPKEAVLATVFAIEMQVLENTITELKERIAKLESKPELIL